MFMLLITEFVCIGLAGKGISPSVCKGERKFKLIRCPEIIIRKSGPVFEDNLADCEILFGNIDEGDFLSFVGPEDAFVLRSEERRVGKECRL